MDVDGATPMRIKIPLDCYVFQLGSIIRKHTTVPISANETLVLVAGKRMMSNVAKIRDIPGAVGGSTVFVRCLREHTLG